MEAPSFFESTKQSIKGLFSSLKPKPKSNIITAGEIQRLMVEAGWVDRRNPPWWGIFDQKFTLPTDEQVWEIIDKDPTNLRQYTEEAGDCDNFAMELRMAFGRLGWSLGVIAIAPDDRSVPHAVFFYVNQHRELKVIEPQADKVYGKTFKLMAVVMF